MESIKTVTSDFVKKSYPERDKWSRKGDSGKLLIIGGSRRYKGAPALCALAALRTGADMVSIAAPETASDVIASFSPNIITEPLEGDYINTENIDKLLALSKRFDAVVIGNGLGRMAKTRDAVVEFLHKTKKPCIIDADALHMISEKKLLLRSGWIITPHGYEFYNLTGGVKLANTLTQRVKYTADFAKKYKTNVVVKGYKDIISNGVKTYINSTGNSFMTVGGTGDVLSGIAGSLLSMGVKSFESAASAAYICGMAGDYASHDFGPGLMATDVIEKIPVVLKKALL